jgi:hypothetical protein
MKVIIEIHEITNGSNSSPGSNWNRLVNSFHLSDTVLKQFSHVCLFRKYFLSIYYVPGIILGTINTLVNKTSKHP